MLFRQTRVKGAAAAAAMVVGMGGLAACSESAGPETGAVALEDLQGLEEQVTGLEERIGVLEEQGMGAGAGVDAGVGAGVAEEADNAGFFSDPGSLLGQEVTVSGEVAEIVAFNPEIGAAFWIGEGSPVPVVSAPMAAGVTSLEQNDVVRIDGTVVQVAQDTFEQDFGVAADELFDDPSAFFSEAEGRPALAANSIEVLQEMAEGSTATN